MTDDLKQLGRELQVQWRHEWQRMVSGPRREADFIAALYALDEGDHAPLAKYLRSDQPVSWPHRQLLAYALDDIFGRGPGHPRDWKIRRALSTARAFFERWKTEAAATGIKTHGHSDAMKEEVARFVADDLESDLNLDPEAILDLWRRPKSRQNS